MNGQPQLNPPATISDGSQGNTAPTLTPPQESTGGGIKTWLSDQRVVGLWTIDQNRNVWVYINGVGWKKLANNSDTAITALTVLAATAKQMNTRYDYREEADGMIHEVYVW